jgi:hypothetical protein
MRKQTIHAVFTEEENAAPVLAALCSAGVQANGITVSGQDSDVFRQSTAVLHSYKFDYLLLWMGFVGTITGAAAGYFGMPAVTGSVQQISLATTCAMVSAAVLGAYAGIWMAGILNLDRFPASDAHFAFGTVRGGNIAISVSVTDSFELERVNRILNQYAPSRLCFS